MQRTSFKLSTLTLGVLLFSAANTSFACSSCGCTLSSDWDSQGLSVIPGLRIDLRYDYLNQNQLRSGKDKLNMQSISYPTDREIEQNTKNQYTTIGLDYSSINEWGFNVQVPYIHRTHDTIGEGDTDLSSSKTSGIGDIRVIGRYQGFLSLKNFGLQLGLKLPTGEFRQNFNAGAQAGNPLDRGLQAGTGTTDLIIGAYQFGELEKNWEYFTQATFQHALNSRDEFKPADSLNLNFGVRYMANENIIPQLQINAKTGGRDSGLNADNDNSGGTIAYLSPGVTISVNSQLKVFGFVQLPIYQKVNGLQLAPKNTVSVGLRYSL